MRTTEADVKNLLDSELTEDQITPFLTTANLLVTQLLGASSLQAALLEQIECWLAAHLTTARDPVIANETIGDASADYAVQRGLGLQSSPYGQQVLMLDTTGTFAGASTAKRPASFRVFG